MLNPGLHLPSSQQPAACAWIWCGVCLCWGLPSSGTWFSHFIASLGLLFSASTQRLDMVGQLFPCRVSPILCPLRSSTGTWQMESMQNKFYKYRKSDRKQKKKCFGFWQFHESKCLGLGKLLSITIIGVSDVRCPSWLSKHGASRNILPQAEFHSGNVLLCGGEWGKKCVPDRRSFPGSVALRAPSMRRLLLSVSFLHNIC